MLRHAPGAIERAAALRQQAPATALQLLRQLDAIAEAVEQRQRPRHVVDDRAVRKARRRVLGSARVAQRRLERLAGQLMVLRRQRQHFVVAQRALLDLRCVPACEAAVPFAPRALEHGAVHHLVQQRVLEGVAARVGR